MIIPVTQFVGRSRSGLENPAILSLDAAETLLISDVSSSKATASSLAKKTELVFSQNQLDAMTSLVFNGNHSYDPDSLLYNFLRKDREKALEVIHKAVDNGWYGQHDGLLRRRLMEFNIFFNNDYEFYDDDRLSQLKKITGFSK